MTCSLTHPSLQLLSSCADAFFKEVCNVTHRTEQTFFYFILFFNQPFIQAMCIFISPVHCYPPTTQPFIVVHLSLLFTTYRSPAIKLHFNLSNELPLLYNSFVFIRMLSFADVITSF